MGPEGRRQERGQGGVGRELHRASYARAANLASSDDTGEPSESRLSEPMIDFIHTGTHDTHQQ